MLQSVEQIPNFLWIAVFMNNLATDLYHLKEISFYLDLFFKMRLSFPLFQTIARFTNSQRLSGSIYMVSSTRDNPFPKSPWAGKQAIYMRTLNSSRQGETSQGQTSYKRSVKLSWGKGCLGYLTQNKLIHSFNRCIASNTASCHLMDNNLHCQCEGYTYIMGLSGVITWSAINLHPSRDWTLVLGLLLASPWWSKQTQREGNEIQLLNL